MKFLMEKYILNLYSGKLFDKYRTGTSYYDDFLTWEGRDYKRKAKGLNGRIHLMSPYEYMYRQHYYGHNGTVQGNTDDEIEKIRKELHNPNLWNSGISTYDYFEDILKSGKRLPMPYLNLANSSQEGRHRAVYAMEKGEKEIPVLVVTEFDN